jgi:hypothetical protein
MSSNLGIKTLVETTSKDILAGLHPTLEVTNIVIASGQNMIRGTCLGKKTETGKYHKWNQTATDGTEILTGILGCDVDAEDEDCKGFMFVHGEFALSALIAENAITPGAYNNGLIVIKEDKL